MSIYRAAYQGFFLRPPLPTPTDTEESSSDSSFDQEILAPEPLLPPAQTFDATTLKIWEHFHAIPLHGNEETLDRFFDDQHSLESRLLAPPAQRFFFAPISPFSKIPQAPLEKRFHCPIKHCAATYTFLKRSLIGHFKEKHPDQMGLLKTYFQT